MVEWRADRLELGLEVADADAKISRPFDSTSSEASSFASTTGLRCGRMMIPVPRRIFEVFAATNDSEMPGSSIGWSGATGDGGTCGSGRMTCSPVHTLSKPACSAALATAAAVFGNAHGPLLMLNSPNFISPRTTKFPRFQSTNVTVICPLQDGYLLTCAEHVTMFGACHA